MKEREETLKVIASLVNKARGEEQTNIIQRAIKEGYEFSEIAEWVEHIRK